VASNAVINAIYESLLQQPAGAAAFAEFSGDSVSAVATAVVTSTAFYQVEVNNLFLAYLNRSATTSEQEGFAQLLVQGATIETVQADILASDEFFADAGGNNTAFIHHLFVDVLNRQPISTELSSFVNDLNSLENGGTNAVTAREEVAYQVLTGAEGLMDRVEGYYVELLGRMPTSAELTAGQNFLEQGLSNPNFDDQAFIAALLSSAEFSNNVNAGITATPDGGFIVGDGVITFSGTGGFLKIDGSSVPLSTDPNKLLGGTVISGFVAGDTIDLTSVAFDGAGHVDLTAGNLLKITEGGVVYDLQLDPTQSFTSDFFHLTSDGAQGTDITENQTPCYFRGTLILTARGEVPIETLAIGDEVMTMSGQARPIKWIGRRSYNGRFVMGRKDILPVCIKAGALENSLPKRDLWISPNHAMYFEDGGVLIEAKDLVNGASIVQAESVERVEYFHIELKTHDVIIAEGALAESFIDDDSRFMFHNAHEYRALYPAAAMATAAQYCAPRLDGGYEVKAVRQRIAARAGLTSNEKTMTGNLRGFVDRITPRVIEGWAQNIDHPEAPVCLDIYAGGRLIGQVLANEHRADLEQAGMGSGRHSFAFMPAGVLFTPDAIEVRRSLDGAPLPPSACIEHALARVA